MPALSTRSPADAGLVPERGRPRPLRAISSTVQPFDLSTLRQAQGSGRRGGRYGKHPSDTSCLPPHDSPQRRRERKEARIICSSRLRTSKPSTFKPATCNSPDSHFVSILNAFRSGACTAPRLYLRADRSGVVRRCMSMAHQTDGALDYVMRRVCGAAFVIQRIWTLCVSANCNADHWRSNRLRSTLVWRR